VDVCEVASSDSVDVDGGHGSQTDVTLVSSLTSLSPIDQRASVSYLHSQSLKIKKSSSSISELELLEICFFKFLC